MARTSRTDADLRAYLDEIGRTPLLTAEQERDLARAAAAGSREDFDALVAANLRFVVAVARRHVGRGLSLTDLIAEGNVGLIHAVSKFDPEAGYRFTTYAWWWITQAIRKAVRDQPPMVRIPSRMIDRIQRWKRAVETLRTDHGREPLPSELAAALDLSRTVVARVEAAARLAEHNTRVGAGDEAAALPVTTVTDELAPPPGEQAVRREELAALQRMLGRLAPRERRILRLRYGLEDGQPRNLRAIGELLELSHERVRVLEQQALRVLRSSLARHADDGPAREGAAGA